MALGVERLLRTPHNKPLNLTDSWQSWQRPPRPHLAFRREGRSWYSGGDLDFLGVAWPAKSAGYGPLRYTAVPRRGRGSENDRVRRLRLSPARLESPRPPYAGLCRRWPIPGLRAWKKALPPVSEPTFSPRGPTAPGGLGMSKRRSLPAADRGLRMSWRAGTAV